MGSTARRYVGIILLVSSLVLGAFCWGVYTLGVARLNAHDTATPPDTAAAPARIPELCRENPSIPAFPDPPPRPTTWYLHDPAEWRLPPFRTLGDYEDFLRIALQEAGYEPVSVWCFRDGFVLVSDIERIDDHAAPVPEPHRWEGSDARMRLSLVEKLRGWIFREPGEWRMLAVVAASEPLTFGRPLVLKPWTARSLSKGGATKLPTTMADRPAGAITVTTLIYVFHQADADEPAVFVATSQWSAPTHLESNGLLDALRKM